MAKKWLIDAHNVIHQIHGLKRRLSVNPADVFREFITLIMQKSRKESVRARIVFDGQPILDHIPKGVDVYFSRERTADEVIISHLKKEGASQKWLVVTDDREIRQHAFYYSVDVIRTNDFLKEKPSGSIEKKPKLKKKKLADPGGAANPELNDDEVQEMLNMFKNANN